MKRPRSVLMITMAIYCGASMTTAAFYNPTTGRWLNRDPMSEETVSTAYISKMSVAETWADAPGVLRYSMQRRLRGGPSMDSNEGGDHGNVFLFVCNTPLNAIDNKGLFVQWIIKQCIKRGVRSGGDLGGGTQPSRCVLLSELGCCDHKVCRFLCKLLRNGSDELGQVEYREIVSPTIGPCTPNINPAHVHGPFPFPAIPQEDQDKLGDW